MSVQLDHLATDPADLEEAETAIFACGTFVPGLVHEPCQHSLVQVLCCAHAGCMNNVWTCKTPLEPDTWGYWISHWAEQKLRTPLGLMLLVLALVAGLSLHGLQAAFTLLYWGAMLAVILIGLTVYELRSH